MEEWPLRDTRRMRLKHMEDYGRNSTAHYHHRHGEGGGRGGSVAAPFVLKTYRMVDDPSTDTVIGWGHDNNSFVVVDPFAFSQALLPSNFKHSNFSSFVRQLNTYGFRKVDPNRWEFAHSSFLRGQTHLLRLIVRRNSGSSGKKKEEGWEEEEVEEEEEKVAAEVVRLKQEQRRIEERMEGMWTRVQETERRPRQMLAFLVKVAGDSKLLDHLPGLATDAIEGGAKRARLCSGTDKGDFAGGRNQFGAWAGIQDGEEAHEAYMGTSVDPVVVGGGPTTVGIVCRGPTAFPLSFPAENGL
ncbi:heat stress transcription factor C-2b-like [Zingiber officinale]|uniref:heat stress transcription factor C-2b-like n=1 Tax=Zingiber officinale TaxID=94328 RepID=UPI001C4CBA6E|nr:heat stress transcription factor C-2b-like [Zingiber officinale]